MGETGIISKHARWKFRKMHAGSKLQEIDWNVLISHRNWSTVWKWVRQHQVLQHPGVTSPFFNTFCSLYTLHNHCAGPVDHSQIIANNILYNIIDVLTIYNMCGGWGIAQSLASLSTKRAVRVRFPLNPLVSERWDTITVLLTRSHQCRRLVQKRPSMCYYVCVIMHVKDP